MYLINQPLLLTIAFRWFITIIAIIALSISLYTICTHLYAKYNTESFTATPGDGPVPADFSIQRAQPDLPTVDEPSESVHYVFWTGGYDSTFRVCEMLLDEDKIVQPIYVTFALDNDCEIEETCNKLWVRRNRKQEKKAMLIIRRAIQDLDPIAAERLLPTRFINQDIDDKEYTTWFENQFYAANLWPKKRKKHQYLTLAKWTAYHKTFVDVGVLGIHNQTVFAKFLKDNLKQIHYVRSNGQNPVSGKLAPPAGINYQIMVPDHPLRYLRFPLWGRSKQSLLDRAKLRGYDNILKMTWSCWFPNATNGKPCGKCPMCRERILPHEHT